MNPAIRKKGSVLKQHQLRGKYVYEVSSNFIGAQS
jgi:hypothetical protein